VTRTNLRTPSRYPSAASPSWITTCTSSCALTLMLPQDGRTKKSSAAGRLFPPRDKSRKPLPATNDWVQWRLKDAKWVATARERLQSLSWLMKCLKEPLARLANRHDKVRGAFFEQRFKSIAILDEESLLATCTYIDLNPVAAGIAEVPEASEHTSVSTRVEPPPSGRLSFPWLRPARSVRWHAALKSNRAAPRTMAWCL
jgi:hypothetical protein